jgi:hypothetical protein
MRKPVPINDFNLKSQQKYIEKHVAVSAVQYISSHRLFTHSVMFNAPFLTTLPPPHTHKKIILGISVILIYTPSTG